LSPPSSSSALWRCSPPSCCLEPPLRRYRAARPCCTLGSGNIGQSIRAPVRAERVAAGEPMKSIRRSYTIPFPIELVYQTITDLNSHADWKPFFQLGGDPTVGAEVDLRFKVARSPRIISSYATVMIAECPTRFAWRTGVSWLFAFEERYELETVGIGTLVHHELRILGLMAPIVKLIMARAIIANLARSEICLAGRLSDQHPPQPRLPLRREGRRPTGLRSKKRR